MGFLQDNTAIAAPNPNSALDANFDQTFGQGTPSSPTAATPPALDIIEQPGQPSSPSDPTGAPMDLGNILARANDVVGTDAMGDTMGKGGFLGSGHSALDVIGGLGDAFAQAGGAPVQYGPGLDARAARAQTAITNDFQNKFNQQGFDKGNIDIANARSAQLGQMSNGLSSLYGDGSPQNVAKVQAALPAMAQALGLDQNSDQYKAYAQGLQTDPKGTIDAMQEALGKGKVANSAFAQNYSALKDIDHKLATDYANNFVHGAPLTEKDRLNLALQLGKLGDSRQRTAAYVANTNAKTGQITSSSGPTGGLTPAALQYAGTRLRGGATASQLFGNGPSGTAMKMAALNEAARQAAENGEDPNVYLNQMKADASSLTKNTNYADSTDRNMNSAKDNADQVLKALGNGAAGQSPLLNRWIQAGRRGVAGDPDLTRFDTAIQAFGREYAAVISGANGGRITDTAQRHVNELINSSMKPGQIRSTIAQMKADMTNVQNNAHRTVGNIKARMTSPRAAPKASSGWGTAKVIG